MKNTGRELAPSDAIAIPSFWQFQPDLGSRSSSSHLVAQRHPQGLAAALFGRMDDVSKEPKAKEERHELPRKMSWSSSDAEALQQAVDAVFNRAGESLLGLTFSLTIADPRLPDFPLIGCSTGFATLCGYTMEEILGRSLGLLGGDFKYLLFSSRSLGS